MGNLNITQMVASQNNKETTSNDSDNELDLALSDNEAILVDDTNARTITATEWTRNMRFTLANDSPVPTAAVVVTVPTTLKGIFLVRNDLSFEASFIVAGQGSGPIVEAGETGMLSSDGTTVIAASLSTSSPSSQPNQKSKFIPVGSSTIVPTAAGGSAVLATVATTANRPDITSLDFDQTASEHAQLRHIFEEAAHAGNVSMQFVWSHAAATTFGLLMQVKGVSIGDDETIDVAFGIAREIDDTGGTTDDLYTTAETGFIKFLTPAQDDLIVMDIARDIADTLDVDARLIGVILHWWDNIPLDSSWASVSLMAGFDGIDGDTTVDDESDGAHAATYTADAQCDRAQSKFSVGSLLIDGTGDVVTFADHADFEIPTEDFTMEGWFRWNTDPAAFQFLTGKWLTAGSQKSYAILYDGIANDLEFFTSTNGSTSNIDISEAFSPNLNQWYHIAVDFDGTTYRLYVDGVVLGTSTTLRTMFAGTATFSVGGQAAGADPFDGWADEVRLTKGVARYAGAFTPPTGPFPRG